MIQPPKVNGKMLYQGGLEERDFNKRAADE